MPDKELQRQARQGTLRGRVSLRQQVQRMLADPKSQALVDNFAAQWLQLRKFAEAQPNRRYYPAFTKQLRRDMRRETELFFGHIVRAGRSVLEFLDCNYAFVNERLARYYGIGGVRGDSFRQVDLVGSAQGGLLSQASMLTLTSNATRTSPVKRGKWILENVLGEPTPPPPPDAPSLAEDSDLRSTATLRQRLEQHRTNPSCAVCHRQMDELGIALENFDAIGGWRMFDGPHEIDASGQLPSGESFRGPVILAPEVVSDFLVGNLLSVLKGNAIRTGKSPFANSIGDEIASPALTLIDDGRQPGGVATRAFDREGTPTRTHTILQNGVLQAFLYDTYEARAAGAQPTGHARGSASSPPSIGSSNLVLQPGSQSSARLCCDPERAVVVSRFSGSCNPITGEFSGVVKGGFLMHRGAKTPIKETLIAGNLFEAWKNVSGISEEFRVINGTHTMPSVRVEDVSVTAG